jgi:putative transcriptional regulator
MPYNAPLFSFIETKLFSRLRGEFLSDDDYAQLQGALIEAPERGAVVSGSGGVRKLRWALPGRGKRGGVRVVYYAKIREGMIWMLTMYGCTRRTKRKASPLTFCARSRRKSMTNAKRNIGLEILAGIREIKRGEHGRVINVPSVSSVRERTGLSQSRFAQLLGVSVRTLQEWEQGRRAPSGAARTLLLIAQRNPRALLDVA